MNRVIITGADGFIGSNVIKLLLEKGVEILAIDIMDRPQRLYPHPLLTYKKIDLFTKQELLKQIEKNKYDTWMQFAWKGVSGLEREDYELQIKNANICLECMKIASYLGCKKYIVPGSIMEYEVVSAIHSQRAITNKEYLYGLGKLISHYTCKAAATEIGIELLWGVVTNAYGPGEYSKRLINNTISKAINGEPLEFSSGVQNYDFVYIDDVARAFYLISCYGKPSCEYVIGSGEARPLKQFIMEMLNILGVIDGYVFGVKKESYCLPLEIFNTYKTRKDTGFIAEVPFADGIVRTREWIEKIHVDR